MKKIIATLLISAATALPASAQQQFGTGFQPMGPAFNPYPYFVPDVMLRAGYEPLRCGSSYPTMQFPSQYPNQFYQNRVYFIPTSQVER